MKINKNYIFTFLASTAIALSFSCNTTFASTNNSLVSKVNADVIILESASLDSNTVAFVLHNDAVKVIDIESDWAKVEYNKNIGYIKSQYLTNVTEASDNSVIETKALDNSVIKTKVSDDNISIARSTDKPVLESTTSENTVKTLKSNNVDYTDWSIAKNIFTIGVPAKIYDLYTGKVYYVKSFSNGNHADVETVTKEDTRIMKTTFGNVWSWDVRPVLVSINGKTMAASINGMPHAIGVNNSNDMDGQVCIHFKGSKTHNGNVSFTKLHQEVALEAYKLGSVK